MFGAFKPELDLPRTDVKFTYLILSQPRTGSTMVSSALEATGMGGVPVEYFNPEHLKALPRPLTISSLNNYYRDVVSRRTTSNGVFGMKLHHDQFSPLFVNDGNISPAGVKFLKSFDRIILTSRRDKVAQAISQLVALRTRHWNSWDKADQGKQNYAFNRNDVPEILAHLHDAFSGETFWEQVCSQLDLRPLKVIYEDMCRDPQTELAKVLVHLGLPAGNVSPQTVKLSRDSNREAKQKFLHEIGVDLSPTA